MKTLFYLITLLIISNTIYSQCNCDNLPQPDSNETVVYVNNETELQNAIDNASGVTTIFLNTGTYYVSSTMYINVYNSDITLRSTTGNRDDVIIQGEGMAASGVGHGITVSGDNVTIADLTVRDVQNHGFFVHPGADNCLFHNVRGLDCGEQIFKASGDASLEPKNDGIIECSAFEYTTTLDDNDDGWYTNGIDLLYCHNWIIRDNTIKNIKHNPNITSNLAGPAILIWYESTNTTIERNRIVECDFGISFGNAGQGGVSHTGGIIKNNFILGYDNSDFGIGLAYAPNAVVINNTIYSPGSWSYSIEARFAETNNCLIMNNLCDEDIWDDRDGASCDVTTNITIASSSDFIDVASGDLHLASGSNSAIDAGTTSSDRIKDIDCGDIISLPDIGADEYASANTGIDEDITDKHFSIYPNPSNGIFTIEGDNIERIEILNNTGQIIYLQNNCSDTNTIEIDNMVSGIYYLRISIDGNPFVQKLILQ